MKYFLDTEFYEHDQTIDLLSVGIVAEDGRELYLQTPLAASWHKDPSACPDKWLRDNVVPYLTDEWATPGMLATKIYAFCSPEDFGKPEFWGYYCDYDWVAFCWLFGRMIDLPKGFPMYCRDVKQWCDMLGNPQLPKLEGATHNALHDARDIKAKWEFLNEYATGTESR